MLFNQDLWPEKQKTLFACTILLPSFIVLNRQGVVCFPFTTNVCFVFLNKNILPSKVLLKAVNIAVKGC